ncbi:damage-inducible protein CinA [Arachidicoccus ginsenosidimutans]|uniref:competence/damage-inducible protein A n=1 Tax=Arachidicoccus sp. BS20 TaxID=1850526 RepID=UPI0007F1653D|nr:competence/damage-inducible protein A [Arachidicoccus sp. BS20]ANI88773.1 damage-inducible protein CinA [Arachidicoccus sp. BS20]
MKHISASIITIGDELLIGQVIDTNSAWLAQELNKTGVWLEQKTSVGDDETQILKGLQDAEKSSDIIILTGGLGPTKDDLTKDILNKYFNGKLVLNEDALRNVEAIFKQYNRPLLEVNYNQALVPDVCKVLLNDRGTAPGMLFEKNGKLFFSLPGVPHEMKAMFERSVLPEIKSHFKLSPVEHRTLITVGIGESFLAERIKDFEANLPQNIKLAYLPATRMVRLRLTEHISSNNSLIDEKFSELQNLLPDVMVANEDISVSAAIGKLLLQKNRTISTAESCTGGYLAHLFTSVAGASQYFYGSIVSYTNDVKANVLGVQKSTLDEFTAVSEQTVKEMVWNVREKMNTDYALATTGIFGPGGGTDETPVGTVWIAVANNQIIKTQKLNLSYTRERNNEATTIAVFTLLKQFMDEGN